MTVKVSDLAELLGQDANIMDVYVLLRTQLREDILKTLLEQPDEGENPLKLVFDKNYLHHQKVPAQVWRVPHNMNKFPSATILSLTLERIGGKPVYDDENNMRVIFTSPTSGYVSLN